MYIKNVHIQNFRNFTNINIPLKAYTTIIGENDSGKSNFMEALKLPMASNDFSFSAKRLQLTDFNDFSMKNFWEEFKKNKDDIRKVVEQGGELNSILNSLPVTVVEISFVDAKNSYEMAILNEWIDEDDDGICYRVRYKFFPRRGIDVIIYLLEMLDEDQDAGIEIFPIDLYDYEITSPNNDKRINSRSISNVKISVIGAERDEFSEGTNRKSNRIVSDMLHKNLSNKDKSTIHQAYDEFFQIIESAESFKKAFNYLENKGISNLDDFVKQIKLIPNFPDLKNIFTNITIGYGQDYLFQKGLGTRNFLLLMILFSYYYSQSQTFNIICVEEPESHLCVNHFNLYLDFMIKSSQVQSSLSQIIVSSHNTKIINKLKLDNVLVLRDNRAIDFSQVDKTLVNYLSKRPNFDTLKLLFTKRIILVEGPTEEMLINTLLSKELNRIFEVEVLAVGHKGFTRYLDIWLELNRENDNVKIGIIRDFDNQENAKKNHDKYDEENKNIMVRTTDGYTLEDDLVETASNCDKLSRHYNIENDPSVVIAFMKKKKAENMLDLCLEISEESLSLDAPNHIKEVIEWIIM